MAAAMLEAEALTRTFGGGKTWLGRSLPAVHAVQAVDLTIREGETLGVVGESGCGKSTLARMLVGLDRPSGGVIRLQGEAMNELIGRDKRALAQRVQYVFQDPVSSLNPRKTIRYLLEAPMIHLLGMERSARRERLEELMDAVNLRAEFLDRYPHEFSGGQAQRIGIARALAADPAVVVLDEPVSALDVSVQAQVLNLLGDLRARFGLTYLFISHDLSVVECVSDRVAVMYFGRVAECAPVRQLFRVPRHPYTRLLIDSVPLPGRRGVRGEEDVVELPDPMHPPAGCAFAPRCPNARARCAEEQPVLRALDERRHQAACHFPLRHDG